MPGDQALQSIARNLATLNLDPVAHLKIAAIVVGPLLEEEPPSPRGRTINPDLERFMANRMAAKTIEVKASRLCLISHPEEIARLILEAAGQRA